MDKGRRTKSGLVIAGLLALSLLAPATASAHTGKGAIVAVSDVARITGIAPPKAPIEARTVDGDQALWLRVAPGHRLIVLGVIREPFLRFLGGRVYVNTHSPTAQIERLTSGVSKPSFDPHSSPEWRQVATGLSYRWHEHRLHVLAGLGGHGNERRLGRWTIPLLLDGNPAIIQGALWFVPAPDVWLWLGISALIIAGGMAMLRLRRKSVLGSATTVLATATLIGVVIARGGRDLYGRPYPTTLGYVSFAIGVVLALVALVYLWRRPAMKPVVAVAIGLVGLVEGIGWLPMLYHGVVLAAVPAAVERACVVVVLGAGLTTILLTIVPERELRERERQRASRTRKRSPHVARNRPGRR
jgi:hypothetical protein